MHVVTPGAYLKHRRTAALLTPRDVAARLSTEPRLAEHVRAFLIELIEADAQPATFATIVALRRAYRFDMDVLAALVAIQQGAQLPAPRLCRICSCSENDACNTIDGPCGWAAHDLCTACVGLAIAIDTAGDADFNEAVLAEMDRFLAQPIAGRSEA